MARVANDRDGIRANCVSLLGFVKEFWPILEPTKEFKDGRAIRALCLHLEAVSDGRIQYLLINVPPGMMKSLLVAVFWPAWEWATRDASLQYLTSSFARPNVLRDNVKMRRIVENEAYQVLFPEVRLDRTSNSREKFETTAMGFREGRAFEGMTGGRADRVIIDDPHSVKGGESEKQREETVKTFREAIPDRLNDLTKSVIVVIMQRLHTTDVAGTILAEGFPYVHLNLPMEYEPTREVNGQKIDARCRTYAKRSANDNEQVLLFEDWRTYEGELLFPERFPAAQVEALKKIKGSYAWAGQYQQRPTAREGGLFKRHWFAGKIIDRATMPIGFLNRVRAWDLAGTAEDEGDGDPDWTAGVRMSRHGVYYYVEHVERDRLSPGGVQALMRSTAETDPLGTILRFPQDPAQAGKAQVISMVSYLAGFTLKPETTAGRGDKVGRASPASIQAEFGHVYLVNSGPPDQGVDPWINVFLDELCTFPKGAHDDQVDAFADAFNDLAMMTTGAFDTASAGPRVIVEAVERDRRYQFGDNDPEDDEGTGFGSAPSNLRRLW